MPGSPLVRLAPAHLSGQRIAPDCFPAGSAWWTPPDSNLPAPTPVPALRNPIRSISPSAAIFPATSPFVALGCPPETSPHRRSVLLCSPVIAAADRPPPRYWFAPAMSPPVRFRQRLPLL